MRNFFTETRKLIGLLAREYAWFRRSLYVAATLAALILLWSLRPQSPERTVARFLNDLDAGNCRAAWRLVAQNRSAMGVEPGAYDAFDRDICETVTATYDKLYFEPWEDQNVDVFGNQAEVTFCACALPVTRSRRICAQHNAVLVRESMRWKILSLPLGPWDNTPCVWNSQRPEALIKPSSPQKRSNPAQ